MLHTVPMGMCIHIILYMCVKCDMESMLLISGTVLSCFQYLLWLNSILGCVFGYCLVLIVKLLNIRNCFNPFFLNNILTILLGWKLS